MHETEKSIADAYDRMPHDPYAPEVVAAYRSFKGQLLDQWEAMHSGFEPLPLGHTVTVLPFLGTGQPYSSSYDMFDQVLNSHHLFVFTGGDMPANHPLAEQSGIVVDGVDFTFNDVFRAVHDIYGHCAISASFSASGEEKAYQEHRRWFTGLAQLALQTETQAQTCWFWYGRHLRRADGSIPKRGEPDYIEPRNRPYAEQKANLVARYL